MSSTFMGFFTNRSGPVRPQIVHLENLTHIIDCNFEYRTGQFDVAHKLSKGSLLGGGILQF